MTKQAFHCVARFGLGAKVGEIASLGLDPKGWLLKQLDSTSYKDIKGNTEAKEFIEKFLRSRNKGDKNFKETAQKNKRKIYYKDTSQEPC